MTSLVKRHGLQAMAILLSVLFVPLFAAAAEEEPPLAVEDAAVAVATVVGIDKETRTLTLRGEDGKEWPFVAGPEVRNFDEIKLGDQVITEYYAAFAIALTPKGSAVRKRVDEVTIQRAEPGEKPAGEITHTITAVGTVEAIDKERRKVTLKGAVNTVVLEVSKDVDLSKVKVGDGVEAVYVESYGVAVRPAPKVSGTVEIKTTSAAFLVGAEWGHGKLTLEDGTVYMFDIKGVSVVDLGISTVKMEGKVFDLDEPKALEGKYLVGEAGAALGVGGAALTMENANGVVLKLSSKQKGVKLTLGAAGLSITNVKPIK